VATLELSPVTAVPVVVLGASNVSRGLARLAAIASCRVGDPLDLFVTAGHGRSYGAASRVAARRLPSILTSGLWRALERHSDTSAEPRRPLALVTDIGNDLLYGFSAEQVAAWVREAVRRLADRGGRIALTRLPLASLATVGPARFRLLRTCFVPGCRLSLEALASAAADLDARIAEVAADHAATLIEQPGAWYGLDAIHLRRRQLDALWHAAGDAWALPTASARASWRDWAMLGSRAAEVRSLARRPRFTPQPVIRRDALRLWLF
jgi:hypothetical protein